MTKKRRKLPIPRRSGAASNSRPRDGGTENRPSSNNAVQDLEDALTQWCMDGIEDFALIPNYMEFYEWLFDWLKKPAEARAFNHAHTNIQSHPAQRIGAFWIVYARHKALMTKAGGGVMAKTSLAWMRDYNKFKLLSGALEKFDQRGREVVEGIASELDRKGAIDQGLSDCTQAQLRFRLNEALERGLDKVAFKIIGKLREEAHDSGELDYLEANAYFRSNNFLDAERIALLVPEDAIDYPASQGLILECLAYQGRLAELTARLRALGPRKLTPAFFTYLMQVTLLNAEDVYAALESFNAIGDGEAWSEAIDNNDEFWPVFNHHSCMTATRFVEERNHIEESESAALQHLTHETPTMVGSADTQQHRWNYLDEFSPTLRRLLPATMLDGDLLRIIEHGEPYIAICNRLLKSHVPHTFEDVHAALLVQLRLGASEPFIKNTIRLFSDKRQVNLATVTPEQIEILEFAYVEARARKNNSAVKKLEQFISLAGLGDDRVTGLLAAAETKEIYQSLSPMGRLAFDSVQYLCNAAQKRNNDWQDAGMVALGFFRILELELNHRILGPMQNDGHAKAVLTALDSTEEFSKPNAVESVNDRKTRDKVASFWKRMKPELVAVLNGRKSGLELGALQLLLDKTRNEGGPDAVLKAVVRTAISGQLSERGLSAYLDGTLSDMISPEVRERFRNPPAHTRFLSLQVALECRAYVEKSLKDMSDWTKARTV